MKASMLPGRLTAGSSAALSVMPGRGRPVCFPKIIDPSQLKNVVTPVVLVRLVVLVHSVVLIYSHGFFT